MRLFVLACVLACLIGGRAANADTVNYFTMVGSGHTFTYYLPTHYIVQDHPHAVLFGGSGPISVDGVPSYYTSSLFYLPGFPFLPAMYVGLPIVGEVVLYGPSVGKATVIPIPDPTPTHPNDLFVTLTPGTFSYVNLGFDNTLYVPYTLTIGPPVPDPVPEPSSLLLLATGSACAAVVIRRRFIVKRD